MKKNLVERLAWLSIFASLLPVAEARIGETKAECVARYGEVHPPQQYISISELEEAVAEHTGETSKQKPDDFLSFRKAGFEIVVGFKEDRAVHIQYHPDEREQSLSKETLFSILQANGNGKKWIMYSTKMFPFSPTKPDDLEQRNSLVLWTEDGDLRATCLPEIAPVIVVMKNSLVPRFEPRLSEQDKELVRGL
jgi:hypothetical protein